MTDDPDMTDAPPSKPKRFGMAPTQPSPQRASLSDPIGYRIAVGGVAAALVAFLIGAAIIAAGGNPVPTEYWSAGSGLAGGLLGILAPTPTTSQPAAQDKRARPFLSEVFAFVDDLWNNRTLVLLFILFVASVVLAAVKNSPEMLTVASAAGGALVGLLAPPPGKSG